LRIKERKREKDKVLMLMLVVENGFVKVCVITRRFTEEGV
jgi:hypothetical protein